MANKSPDTGRAPSCSRSAKIAVVVLSVLLLITAVALGFVAAERCRLADREHAFRATYMRLAQGLLGIYASSAGDLAFDLSGEAEDALSKDGLESRNALLWAVWDLPTRMRNIYTAGRANYDDKDFYNNAYDTLRSAVRCLTPGYEQLVQLPDETKLELSKAYRELSKQLSSESGAYGAVFVIETEPEKFTEAIGELKPVISQIDRLLAG